MQNTKSSKKKKEIKNWVKLGISMLALIFVLVWGVLQNKEAKKIEACSEFAVKNRHVFLIDRTTVLTEGQARGVRSSILGIIEKIDPGAQISIYDIDPDKYIGVSEPHFDACKPRNGVNANELIENARLLEKNYEELFQNPLGDALNIIGSTGNAESSPLFEAMMDVAILGRFGENGGEGFLYMYSDLLQHSGKVSFYKQDPGAPSTWEAVKKSGYIPLLNNTEVNIFLLLNHEVGEDPNEINDLVKIWEKYFIETGASLKIVSKLR